MDNIKMYFNEIVGEGTDWWALVNTVTNFWVPKMWGISQLGVLTRLSRRTLELLLSWSVSQSGI
jgi:hypothetical protein